MNPIIVIPEDHDQRFKALIREFFAEFLELFFENWAKRFDLTTIEWLDKELLPDPPDGARHVLDLVAKLRALEPIQENASGDSATWLALVHIEVESPDRTTAIKPRLPAYAIHLGDRYGLPVLPIVIYLNVALDGIGVDSTSRMFWELEVLRFQYLYVGLPGLAAERYAAGDNWLGVALSALMKIPKARAVELGTQALQRLQTAGLTDQQLYLLEECVEAYLPVDDDELAAIRDTMKSVTPREKAMARNKTSYDLGLAAGRQAGREEGREVGLEEGREKGREEGIRTVLIENLEAYLDTRFGPLSETTLIALRAKSTADLRTLALTWQKAHSLAELGL